ncbi:MAG TPA: hypothetical protein VG433_09540 [Pirellulales bacterium]|nr:hypothetical protein [Pirellulales bacterium]
MRTFLAVLLGLIVAGCSGKSVATYRVSHDSDTFNEVVNDKLVKYADWQFTVDGKTIPIPHEPSTIVVHRDGQRVQIEVNGKSVYDH